MVGNISSKPFGFVLIIAAHMVLYVLSQEEVIGILGTNVTLHFTFIHNVSLKENRHFSVYITGEKKIAQYQQDKQKDDIFYVYPKNKSVRWSITNLKLNDSEIYYVGFFSEPGHLIKSEMVQLIVREENRSSTVPPMQTGTPKSNTGSSYLTVPVLVVPPVVVLAAVLPCLIWCLVRTKDNQQQQQQTSTPTVQETVEASKDVPAPPLVYSVLDFPKRPPGVLEVKQSQTEYASVGYLP